MQAWLKSPKPDYDAYLVVLGSKGIGKTSIIETATRHRPGIVDVRARSGDSDAMITDAVLGAIANTRSFAHIRLDSSARRVLFWYRLIPFAPAPTVCLQISEVLPGTSYPDVTGAVKSLVHEFNLRIIVDSSDHSLPNGVLATGRQKVLTVEEMSAEEVMADPRLKQLFLSLQAENLDKVVWAICGGNPLKLMRCIHEGAATVLLEELAQARKHRDQFKNKALLEEFKTKDEVPVGEIELPPNKALRVRSKGTTDYLVPASPATKVMLRNDMKLDVTIEDLKKMFESSPSPVSLSK